MIGRIIKTFANEALRRRAAKNGGGLRRLPPTSMHEAQARGINHVVRTILNRFMSR